jgi:hypothetical protein
VKVRHWLSRGIASVADVTETVSVVIRLPAIGTAQSVLRIFLLILPERERGLRVKRCNAMQSSSCPPTFRRNVLLLISGRKST